MANLFDSLGPEEAVQVPEWKGEVRIRRWFAFTPDQCQHRRKRKTLTVWPGETEERVTATCDDCGLVQGWYYDCR